MTNNLSSSKLPTPIASESNRRDGGKFFPPSGSTSSASSDSFESLIPRKNEPKNTPIDTERLENTSKKDRPNLPTKKQLNLSDSSLHITPYVEINLPVQSAPLNNTASLDQAPLLSPALSTSPKEQPSLVSSLPLSSNTPSPSADSFAQNSPTQPSSSSGNSPFAPQPLNLVKAPLLSPALSTSPKEQPSLASSLPLSSNAPSPSADSFVQNSQKNISNETSESSFLGLSEGDPANGSILIKNTTHAENNPIEGSAVKLTPDPVDTKPTSSHGDLPDLSTASSKTDNKATPRQIEALPTSTTEAKVSTSSQIAPLTHSLSEKVARDPSGVSSPDIYPVPVATNPSGSDKLMKPQNSGTDNAPISLDSNPSMNRLTPNGTGTNQQNSANLELNLSPDDTVSAIAQDSSTQEKTFQDPNPEAFQSALSPVSHRPHMDLERTQEASSVFKNVGLEMEKMKEAKMSSVQIDLQISQTETVKIRLHLQGNELRSTFITTSPDLREALQKYWPEFAHSTPMRDFRFANPDFQSPPSQNESFSQGQRRDSQTSEQNATPYPSPSTRSQRLATPQRPINPNTNDRVSLWA